MPHTLTHHRDIRNWVAGRKGVPAIARVRNRYGEERALLRLSFGGPDRANPISEDDGLSPCSWSAWLAELDRQHLALQVGSGRNDFTLVHRRELH